MTDSITVWSGNGCTRIETIDRQRPPSEFSLVETPWVYGESGEEEHVLHIVIESEVAKFSQSDIKRLLPYLERFARMGKLLEGT